MLPQLPHRYIGRLHVAAVSSSVEQRMGRSLLPQPVSERAEE